MSQEKKPLGNDQSNKEKLENLNERKGGSFEKGEKTQNKSDTGNFQYISKPKISSQDTTQDTTNDEKK